MPSPPTPGVRQPGSLPGNDFPSTSPSTIPPVPPASPSGIDPASVLLARSAIALLALGMFDFGRQFITGDLPGHVVDMLMIVEILTSLLMLNRSARVTAPRS